MNNFSCYSSALLFFLLMVVTESIHADSQQNLSIQVNGTIKAPPIECTTKFIKTDGIYNIGDMLEGNVSPFNTIEDSVEIICNRNVTVRVKATDNNAALRGDSNNENQFFLASSDRASVGTYTIIFDNGMVDGKTANFYADGQSNGRREANLSNEGKEIRWGRKGKQISALVKVTPSINGRTEVQPIDNDINVNGSATLSFSYGL